MSKNDGRKDGLPLEMSNFQLAEVLQHLALGTLIAHCPPSEFHGNREMKEPFSSETLQRNCPPICGGPWKGQLAPPRRRLPPWSVQLLLESAPPLLPSPWARRRRRKLRTWSCHGQSCSCAEQHRPQSSSPGAAQRRLEPGDKGRWPFMASSSHGRETHPRNRSTPPREGSDSVHPKPQAP